MLHHIIGVIVGAVAAWFVLVVTNASSSTQYVTALVVGGIVSILWPIVFVWWLGRRAKARRNDQISKEVDDQMKARGG